MDFSDAMLLRMTVHERAAFLQRLIASGGLEVVGVALLIKPPPSAELDLTGVEKSSGFNLRVALVRLLSALSGDDVRPFELKALPPQPPRSVETGVRHFLQG